jgi:predicted O-linked N-acetylglucosamine transferase (SPINDLY family)
LRLGFLSPDFHYHPVGYFLVGVLENLDREQCETICYSDGRTRDDLTVRFHAAAAIWRETRRSSDEQLAEQIRTDQIDVLFDLSGHTAHNRLLVFARKPAPVQVTWLGYEGTTGLVAIDYLLADRHVVPKGTEAHYQEKVLRMPDGYVCYDPPATAPSVNPLPACDKGYVTFGSFNNLAKINPEVVALWARILRRVPGSRLAMKYKGLGDQAVKSRYLELFAASGVSPDRLDLLPPSPFTEYLAAYQQVDIGLDPFPFSGGATTCESLWMGVPVITCPGETFASRHCLSHLAGVGLTETVARDLDEYVELAATMAGDLPRLSALRLRLRAQMEGSPLCDGRRFATDFTHLVRDVWRHWVASRDYRD